MRSWIFALIAIACVVAGCATYRDELARAQKTFEQNEHERTMALLRDLEPDVAHLSGPERAQYCYLRGMTDYRVGYRADARHWLALAKAYDENSPGVLPTDWKARTLEALEELNGVVYSDGTSALATQKRPGGEEVSTPKAK